MYLLPPEISFFLLCNVHSHITYENKKYETCLFFLISILLNDRE